MPERHVLVVDDEDDIREVAQMSLELVGGYAVRGAGSGAEALALARAERPAAILLDVMMPDLDGPGVCRALRADPLTRDIPIVLLTAKVQARERQAFTQLGVAGVLAKPFDPMTLAADLARLLGWEAPRT